MNWLNMMSTRPRTRSLRPSRRAFRVSGHPGHLMGIWYMGSRHLAIGSRLGRNGRSLENHHRILLSSSADRTVDWRDGVANKLRYRFRSGRRPSRCRHETMQVSVIGMTCQRYLPRRTLRRGGIVHVRDCVRDGKAARVSAFARMLLKSCVVTSSSTAEDLLAFPCTNQDALSRPHQTDVRCNLDAITSEGACMNIHVRGAGRGGGRQAKGHLAK